MRCHGVGHGFAYPLPAGASWPPTGPGIADPRADDVASNRAGGASRGGAEDSGVCNTGCVVADEPVCLLCEETRQRARERFVFACLTQHCRQRLYEQVRLPLALQFSSAHVATLFAAAKP